MLDYSKCDCLVLCLPFCHCLCYVFDQDWIEVSASQRTNVSVCLYGVPSVFAVYCWTGVAKLLCSSVEQFFIHVDVNKLLQNLLTSLLPKTGQWEAP